MLQCHPLHHCATLFKMILSEEQSFPNQCSRKKKKKKKTYTSYSLIGYNLHSQSLTKESSTLIPLIMPNVLNERLIGYFSCTADVSFLPFPTSLGSHYTNSRNAVYHVSLFLVFELMDVHFCYFSLSYCIRNILDLSPNNTYYTETKPVTNILAISYVR